MTPIQLFIVFVGIRCCKPITRMPWKFTVLSILAMVLLMVPELFSTAFASQVSSKSITKANVIIEKGQRLLSKADYKSAEQAFKQALLLTPPSQEKTIINLLNFIGVSLHSQNKDIESALYFKKALAKLPGNLKVNDLRRAKILSNLSLAYTAQGKLAESQKCSDEAINIFRSAKMAPLELSVALNSYGRLKLDAGELKEAESLFAESVSVRQSINGTSSKDLVSPMINLSSALLQQGKFEQAETVCKKAIDICEKGHLSESAAVLPLLCQLGQLEAAQHRYKQSLKALEKARTIADQVIGMNSEEALMVRLILSETYDNDGQPELAEKNLLQAVDISKFAFGTQHSRTVETTLSLAQLYERHGNSSEADRLRLFCRLSGKQ